MSNFEENLKRHTDESVNTFKKIWLKKTGSELNGVQELIFRAGISHGIMIGGLSMTKADTSYLLDKE